MHIDGKVIVAIVVLVGVLAYFGLVDQVDRVLGIFANLIGGN